MFQQGEQMYLDSNDRNVIKIALDRYYFDRYVYISDRAHEVNARILFLVTLVYLGILIVVTKLTSHSWVILLIGILFVFVIRTITHWTIRKGEKVPYREEIESRLKEIEELDASVDDRELFLRLIAVLITSNREKLQEVLEEVSHMPRLSDLMFVRELRNDLQEFNKHK